MPMYRTAHISGYVGGSTIDRVPLEDAVINQALRFKATAAATRKRTEHDGALIAYGKSLGLVGVSQRMLDLYQPYAKRRRAPPKPNTRYRRYVGQ